MSSQICVTCRNEKPVNRTDNRLVTESCGHVKCMDCLLLEKAGCEACLAEKTEKSKAEVSDTDDGFAGDTALPSDVMKSFKDTINGFNEMKNGFEDTNNEFVEITNNGMETTNHELEPIDEHVEVNNEEQNILEDLSKRKKLETSHIRIETDANGKFYLCTVCKKRFHARSHVAYHAYCNGQSKPYACALCPQSFVSQSHYKYHMRVHRNERPYVCDVCGQNFIQTSKLQRHKLKHTKEKKHTCVQCNKAFDNMTALRKHALIHTEERPYACPTCGFRFRDASNFQRHVKKHNILKRSECACKQCGRAACGGGGRCLARRRHQCGRCPQAFHSSKDLRRHVAVHTDSKPFRCKVCERNFRRKDNLERHIRNTHPDHSAATAAAVECDETALQQLSAPNRDYASEKTQLEILNPLPPLPIELIQTIETKTTPEIDKSYILFANNARQSVIVGKPIIDHKPTDSPCEYVHKIRKANSMAHQKKIQLPPIDETKMRELANEASLNNCIVTPPKDKKKFMKILYEDDEERSVEPNVEAIPQVHWRKMKLNKDGIKNQDIEGIPSIL